MKSSTTIDYKDTLDSALGVHDYKLMLTILKASPHPINDEICNHFKLYAAAPCDLVALLPFLSEDQLNFLQNIIENSEITSEALSKALDEQFQLNKQFSNLIIKSTNLIRLFNVVSDLDEANNSIYCANDAYGFSIESVSHYILKNYLADLVLLKDESLIKSTIARVPLNWLDRLSTITKISTQLSALSVFIDSQHTINRRFQNNELKDFSGVSLELISQSLLKFTDNSPLSKRYRELHWSLDRMLMNFKHEDHEKNLGVNYFLLFGNVIDAKVIENLIDLQTASPNNCYSTQILNFPSNSKGHCEVLLRFVGKLSNDKYNSEFLKFLNLKSQQTQDSLLFYASENGKLDTIEYLVRNQKRGSLSYWRFLGVVQRMVNNFHKFDEKKARNFIVNLLNEHGFSPKMFAGDSISVAVNMALLKGQATINNINSMLVNFDIGFENLIKRLIDSVSNNPVSEPALKKLKDIKHNRNTIESIEGGDLIKIIEAINLIFNDSQSELDILFVDCIQRAIFPLVNTGRYSQTQALELLFNAITLDRETSEEDIDYVLIQHNSFYELIVKKAVDTLVKGNIGQDIANKYLFSEDLVNDMLLYKLKLTAYFEPKVKDFLASYLTTMITNTTYNQPYPLIETRYTRRTSLLTEIKHKFYNMVSVAIAKSKDAFEIMNNDAQSFLDVISYKRAQVDKLIKLYPGRLEIDPDFGTPDDQFLKILKHIKDTPKILKEFWFSEELRKLINNELMVHSNFTGMLPLLSLQKPEQFKSLPDVYKRPFVDKKHYSYMTRFLIFIFNLLTFAPLIPFVQKLFDGKEELTISKYDRMIKESMVIPLARMLAAAFSIVILRGSHPARFSCALEEKIFFNEGDDYSESTDVSGEKVSISDEEETLGKKETVVSNDNVTIKDVVDEYSESEQISPLLLSKTEDKEEHDEEDKNDNKEKHNLDKMLNENELLDKELVIVDERLHVYSSKLNLT